MHGAAFFASWQGMVEETILGVGRGNSQTRGIFGAGRAALKSFGQGGPGQPFFPGKAGRGMHPWLGGSLFVFPPLMLIMGDDDAHYDDGDDGTPRGVTVGLVPLILVRL